MLPLVLLHGFGTSQHVWDRVRPQLTGPVLAVDLPGFGDTLDARYTVDGMADAVQEGIQAAGLERYVLAGHSMGGKVAAVLAARRPAGLCGLLLVAPSPPSPEPMTDEGRAGLRALYGQRELLRQQYLRVSRQPLPDRELQQLVEDGCRGSEAAWHAWPDAGSKEHHEDEMTRVQVPIFLLTSEDDPVISPGVVAGQLTTVFPRARHTTLRGCGHLTPLEQPDEVAAVLKAAALDYDAT